MINARNIIVQCGACAQVWRVQLPRNLNPSKTMSFVCWSCNYTTPGESVSWVELSNINWNVVHFNVSRKAVPNA